MFEGSCVLRFVLCVQADVTTQERNVKVNKKIQNVKIELFESTNSKSTINSKEQEARAIT